MDTGGKIAINHISVAGPFGITNQRSQPLTRATQPRSRWSIHVEHPNLQDGHNFTNVHGGINAKKGKTPSILDHPVKSLNG